MNSESGSIQTRADGSCGTIIIKHSARCNALSRTMIAELLEAFGDLHQQPGVRGVVLTGADQTFCSGTDLYELQQTRQDQAPEAQWFADAEQQRELLTTILRFPKPVIAAVNGSALGLGMALVAACDLVMATPNATFSLPEPQRGLTAGAAIPLLAFRLGAATASHLLMRGLTIDAKEAQRLGLVQELVEFDSLWIQANQWIQEISKSSSVSVSMTKRVLNETVGEALLTQLSVAAAAVATARTTDDAKEGVDAYLEKRAPNWSGS